MRDVPAMEWGRTTAMPGGRSRRARPWRERGAGRPRQAVRRGLAGRAAREGAGAARRPAQGGVGRPAGRSREGAAEEAGGRGHGEREVREGEARRKRAKGKTVFLSDLSVENE